MIQRRQVLVGEARLRHELLVAVSWIKKMFHDDGALGIVAGSIQHPLAPPLYRRRAHIGHHRWRIGSAGRAVDVVGRHWAAVTQWLAGAVDLRLVFAGFLNVAEELVKDRNESGSCWLDYVYNNGLVAADDFHDAVAETALCEDGVVAAVELHVGDVIRPERRVPVVAVDGGR